MRADLPRDRVGQKGGTIEQLHIAKKTFFSNSIRFKSFLILKSHPQNRYIMYVLMNLKIGRADQRNHLQLFSRLTIRNIWECFICAKKLVIIFNLMRWFCYIFFILKPNITFSFIKTVNKEYKKQLLFTT